METSLRTMILLFTRFNDDWPFVVVPCCNDPSAVSASVSACSTPLNQLIPNWNGFARGEPFRLNMLSPFLGRRSVDGSLLLVLVDPVLPGYRGVLGGREGLKLELDGTRLVCWCAGAINFPGLGLTGDAGRDRGLGFIEDPTWALKGGLDFVGAGDAGIREGVRG